MYTSRKKLPPPGSINVKALEHTLLWSASEELAYNSKVHPEVVALTLLGGISAVAQGRFDVKLPYDVIRPVSINALIVVESGYGKSVIYEKVMMPIQRLQREERKKSVLLADDEEDAVTALRSFQLLYKDVTPEGLFASLQRSIPSAALATDEAEVFFKSAMSGARGHLNTLWDGRDTIVMRANKDDIVLEDVRLMLMLMAQPAVVNDFLEKKGALARDSGMLARFIVCAPDKRAEVRIRTLGEKQDSKLWAAVEQRIDKLARLNLSLRKGQVFRQPIEFEHDAASYWIDIVNDIEVEMMPGGRFEHVKDHASKLGENIARIAALIQIFEMKAKITVSTLIAAVELCCYYSMSFNKIFMPAPRFYQDAQILYPWLLERLRSGCQDLSYNVVRQCGPASLRDKARLKEAVDHLVCNGLARVYMDGKTKKISLNIVGTIPPVVINNGDMRFSPYSTWQK
ncbi:YfjI family protein [Ectopseudomonas guguanensis]|uniref:DUF3987 domain-containing protein n=1 Tax=Ectopseudomonas guguanensis TaxID=1198456 RepID=A0A1H0VSI2_9GAMM|nr:YfjI family protein [Pseudomonas guguanensis]SDP81477.1 Protein of unknown function [Pseudomonas guguanensis]